MKKLLSLALALLAAGLALAADPAPTHRVDDLGNCYRLNPDGSETNIGQPADAIANNPAEASGIQRAALKLLADFRAQQVADLSAAQASAAAQVAAKESEKAAAITELETRLAAAAAQIAALQKQIRDLGATPVAAP